jgi:hypothetical protein
MPELGQERFLFHHWSIEVKDTKTKNAPCGTPMCQESSFLSEIVMIAHPVFRTVFPHGTTFVDYYLGLNTLHPPATQARKGLWITFSSKYAQIASRKFSFGLARLTL